METLIEAYYCTENSDELICDGHRACDGDSCSSEDCLVGA